MLTSGEVVCVAVGDYGGCVLVCSGGGVHAQGQPAAKMAGCCLFDPWRCTVLQASSLCVQHQRVCEHSTGGGRRGLEWHAHRVVHCPVLHMLMHACLVAPCPKGQGWEGPCSHRERETLCCRGTDHVLVMVSVLGLRQASHVGVLLSAACCAGSNAAPVVAWQAVEACSSLFHRVCAACRAGSCA